MLHINSWYYFLNRNNPFKNVLCNVYILQFISPSSFRVVFEFNWNIVRVFLSPSPLSLSLLPCPYTSHLKILIVPTSLKCMCTYACTQLYITQPSEFIQYCLHVYVSRADHLLLDNQSGIHPWGRLIHPFSHLTTS